MRGSSLGRGPSSGVRLTASGWQDAVPRIGKLYLFSRPGQRIILNQLGEVRVRPNPLELQQQVRALLLRPPLVHVEWAPAGACLLASCTGGWQQPANLLVGCARQTAAQSSWLQSCPHVPCAACRLGAVLTPTSL